MLSLPCKTEPSEKTYSDSSGLCEDLINIALSYGDVSYFEHLLSPPVGYHGSYAGYTNDMHVRLAPYLESYYCDLLKKEDEKEKKEKIKTFVYVDRFIQTRINRALQEMQLAVCSSDSESSDCSKSKTPGIAASDSGDSDLSPGADDSAQPSNDSPSSRNSASLSPKPDISFLPTGHGEQPIINGRTSSASTVPHNHSPPPIIDNSQFSVSQKLTEELDGLDCQSTSHDSGVSEGKDCKSPLLRAGFYSGVRQNTRDFDCQSPLLGAGFYKKSKNEIEEEDGPCLGCVAF